MHQSCHHIADELSFELKVNSPPLIVRIIILIYRTRAIITRGLYTFYPLFEVQKRFFKGFFLKILALCMVSIQERVMMARVRYIILFCFVFVPTFFFRSTNFHVFEKIDFPFWNMHAFTKWVHYDTNFSAALLGHLFCGASLNSKSILKFPAHA